MMKVTHSGAFESIDGHIYTVEIRQSGTFDSEPDEMLLGDTPLTIEWGHQDKHEPLQGSTATLTVESQTDRQYIGLYAIDPLEVRMDVYRDGELYWSGHLDAEFYEEPYERGDHYDVSLTFSDLGVLDRMDYACPTGAGAMSIEEMVMAAIDAADLGHCELQTNLVSTTAPGGKNAVSAVAVRCDNFIDEDGKPMKWKEALEGALQPLGMKLTQRAGKFHIYDLNGLYEFADAPEAYWTSDSQTLGVDRVAQKAVVKFSPYSEPTLLSDELEYGGKYDLDHSNIGSNAPVDAGEYGEYYTYYPDYGEEAKTEGKWDYTYQDFTIFLSDKAEGLASIGSGCKYFYIQSVVGSASDCAGVAYAFRTGGHGSLKSGWPEWKLHDRIPKPSAWASDTVLTTKRVYLPPLPASERKRYYLRLTQEILADCRYNPFGPDGVMNEEGNDGRLKTCSAFVFIPASVTLYDNEKGGNALLYYDNDQVARTNAPGRFSTANRGWKSASGNALRRCWLEYYKPDSLREDAGVRGWTTNRHCVGRTDYGRGRTERFLYGSFKKIPDGEYIAYPPQGGWIEVTIQAGIIGHDYAEGDKNAAFGGPDSQWDRKNIYATLRWLLYKAPKLEIVNANLAFDEAETNDVEYTGWINRAAKETISIDTICGTGDGLPPTAKGRYVRAIDLKPIDTLTRGGRTLHPEELLIGTLISQYADRRTVLSGEVALCPDALVYTERNQKGALLMMMSETQDLRHETSEIEICELRPDEYTGEFEN